VVTVGRVLLQLPGPEAQVGRRSGKMIQW
jgi:hypothetical protein